MSTSVRVEGARPMPQKSSRRIWLRRLLPWLGPLAALGIFGAVVWVLQREIAQLHMSNVMDQLHAIPHERIALALGFTALSYSLLSCYDWLALRYLGKKISYPRVLFTAFIAYSFGHTLGFPAVTGAAIRFRLYSTAGITAIDVATISAFSSMAISIGLATICALSLLFMPEQATRVLHVDQGWSMLVAVVLLGLVGAYALWTCIGRTALEIRGWALRPPGAAIGLPQVFIGVIDMALAALVVWALLPSDADVNMLAFLGAYAAAVIAGIASHVPGGLGVFETVMLLALPQVRPEGMLGALLAYRAIYYLVPLLFGTVLFASQEVAGQRTRIARAQALASLYVAPVVPQITGTLTFLAGTLLLVSGATPAIGARLHFLHRFLALPILEFSHLAGSVIGLGLLVLSRALFRRVQAAYYISFWLLAGGIIASILKGLDFEEASILALVLGVLHLGRRAFYRPTAILAERLTPVWIAAIAGVIAMALFLGVIASRQMLYSQHLWWTFAFDAQAPRSLRALFVVVVLATACLLLSALRPARPEPAVAGEVDLHHARKVIATSHATLANAALMGDKRLLFSDSGDAFVMYQIAGQSWIALGDPVGPQSAAEELVWRFRELSDRHGGEIVFYQVAGERLALYVDLGLAALKIGEEARVSLPSFSLDGAQRADLRQAHRRAERDGATFEVVPASKVEALLPSLKAISDSWLAAKSTAEKGFSIGSFSPEYLRNFPLALVRTAGQPSAFANLWLTGSKDELSVDLMRFGPGAPRGAMDYLFIELMLWGRSQGYRWFNLGMAPLSGLEHHPLAPAWHRVGNFVFQNGEHFYNFEGLRKYKAKFDPVWEPRYLVTRGGIALPRVLIDVSVLIAGGVRELLVK